MDQEPYRIPPLLVGLLVLAGLLRVLAAATEPLYVDESFTYFVAQQSMEGLVLAARLDAHPPTFYLFCHVFAPWISSPFLLRLPSIAFSLASIALAHRLAWEVSPRPLAASAALGTSALMAFSYYSWHNEILLRSNALLELTMLVVAWDLFSHRGHERPWRWSLLAYPLAPLLNTLAVVPVVGLSLLFPGQGQSRRGQYLATALALLAGLAWMAYTADSAEMRTVRAPSNVSWALLPADALGLGLAGSWPGWRGQTGPAYLAITYLLTALSWLACGMATTRLSRWQWLPGLSFFIPWAAVIALSLLRGGQWYQSRYLVPYFFGFYFCLALAATMIFKARAAWPLALWAATQIISWGLFLRDPYYWNQDWPAVTQFFRRHPLNSVLVYHGFNTFGLSFYYYQKPLVLFTQSGVHIAEGAFPQAVPLVEVRPNSADLAWLEQFRGQRVGVVLCQERDPRVRQLVSAHCGVVDQLQIKSLNSWGNIEAYVVDVLP